MITQRLKIDGSNIVKDDGSLFTAWGHNYQEDAGIENVWDFRLYADNRGYASDGTISKVSKVIKVKQTIGSTTASGTQYILELTTDKPHNFVVNDLIILSNFGISYDSYSGSVKVSEVVSSTVLKVILVWSTRPFWTFNDNIEYQVNAIIGYPSIETDFAILNHNGSKIMRICLQLDRFMDLATNLVLPAGLNDTSIYVNAVAKTNWPNSGIIQIGNEQISYNNIANPFYGVELQGCVRGVNGTTQATHNVNDSVNLVLAPHDQIINQTKLNKLRKFCDLAAKYDIYLIINGCNSWYANNQLNWLIWASEEVRWNAHETMWRGIAQTLKGHPAVAWYSLISEPVDFNLGEVKVDSFSGGKITATIKSNNTSNNQNIRPFDTQINNNAAGYAVMTKNEDGKLKTEFFRYSTVDQVSGKIEFTGLTRQYNSRYTEGDLINNLVDAYISPLNYVTGTWQNWTGSIKGFGWFNPYICISPRERSKISISRAWISRMKSAIREIDVDTPITIGYVADQTNSSFLPNNNNDLFEIISPHLYTGGAFGASSIDTLITILQQCASYNKPVMLEEGAMTLDTSANGTALSQFRKGVNYLLSVKKLLVGGLNLYLSSYNSNTGWRNIGWKNDSNAWNKIFDTINPLLNDAPSNDENAVITISNNVQIRTGRRYLFPVGASTNGGFWPVNSQNDINYASLSTTLSLISQIQLDSLNAKTGDGVFGTANLTSGSNSFYLSGFGKITGENLPGGTFSEFEIGSQVSGNGIPSNSVITDIQPAFLGNTITINNNIQTISTQLDGSLNNFTQTINVLNTSKFASSGTIQVDSEQITYTGITDTAFTGCTRGANGTTSASHSNRATVNSIALNNVRVKGSYHNKYSRNYVRISNPSGSFEQAAILPLNSFSLTSNQTFQSYKLNAYYNRKLNPYFIITQASRDGFAGYYDFYTSNLSNISVGSYVKISGIPNVTVNGVSKDVYNGTFKVFGKADAFGYFYVESYNYETGQNYGNSTVSTASNTSGRGRVNFTKPFELNAPETSTSWSVVGGKSTEANTGTFYTAASAPPSSLSLYGRRSNTVGSNVTPTITQALTGTDPAGQSRTFFAASSINGLASGDKITITGMSDPVYNGTFTINYVISFYGGFYITTNLNGPSLSGQTGSGIVAKNAIIWKLNTTTNSTTSDLSVYLYLNIDSNQKAKITILNNNETIRTIIYGPYQGGLGNPYSINPDEYVIGPASGTTSPICVWQSAIDLNSQGNPHSLGYSDAFGDWWTKLYEIPGTSSTTYPNDFYGWLIIGKNALNSSLNLPNSINQLNKTNVPNLNNIKILISNASNGTTDKYTNIARAYAVASPSGGNEDPANTKLATVSLDYYDGVNRFSSLTSSDINVSANNSSVEKSWIFGEEYSLGFQINDQAQIVLSPSANTHYTFNYDPSNLRINMAYLEAKISEILSPKATPIATIV